MSSSQIINDLLQDKLFQVIGSTPKSIAESLSKLNLAGNSKIGAQIFAIAVFASAVNKATLETFVADARFAEVRPMINAALSIQGRSNMTALTLLGHCLLTTDTAKNINFTSEFRKKMGQDHLWAGELTSSSLSDKQKEILKEKKRLTDASSAMALGSGFLKLVKIDTRAMTQVESDLFNLQISANTGDSQGARTALSTTGYNNTPTTPPRTGSDNLSSRSPTMSQVPVDVMNYRRNVIGQSDDDIKASLERRGIENFLLSTREMMARDPDGTRTRNAQSSA